MILQHSTSNRHEFRLQLEDFDEKLSEPLRNTIQILLVSVEPSKRAMRILLERCENTSKVLRLCNLVTHLRCPSRRKLDGIQETDRDGFQSSAE
jgi:hypothetical protein